MKPQQLWTGVIGVALACVGIAIVGAVTYLLYPSVSPQSNSAEAVVYSCPGMIITALFSNNQARVTFADGRIFDVTRVPSAAGPNLKSEVWARYLSADGSFVFWSTGQRALIEEDGIVTGECFAKGN